MRQRNRRNDIKGENMVDKMKKNENINKCVEKMTVNDEAGRRDDEYVYLRAKRGQTINSHSLAERVFIFFPRRIFVIYLVKYYIIYICSPYLVFFIIYINTIYHNCFYVMLFQVRRQRISDKMKVLQSLVPGCEKVCASFTMHVY